MATDLTTYSSYNFDTKFFSVGTSLSDDTYTPPYNSRYIVKGIRFTNYTNNNVTLSLKAYNGDTAEEHYISADEVIAGKSTYEALNGTPYICDGQRGDKLRMAASAADSVDVMITYMVLGRESGL